MDLALYAGVPSEKVGLRPAIKDFIAASHEHWRVVYDTKLSNGLIILERA